MTTTAIYSNATEKKVAAYLDQLATIKLEGHGCNSYKQEVFNRLAHELVIQFMRDNDELTAYSATLAEIKLELEQ